MLAPMDPVGVKPTQQGTAREPLPPGTGTLDLPSTPPPPRWNNSQILLPNQTHLHPKPTEGFDTTTLRIHGSVFCLWQCYNWQGHKEP